MTATGKGAGPQSEVCRELKTAGLLAIGPLGLMAGGPEDHFTDSRELYVLVEGDEWAHVEALDPDAGYWARRFAQLVNWRARGEKAVIEPTRSTSRERHIGRRLHSSPGGTRRSRAGHCSFRLRGEPRRRVSAAAPIHAIQPCVGSARSAHPRCRLSSEAVVSGASAGVREAAPFVKDEESSWRGDSRVDQCSCSMRERGLGEPGERALLTGGGNWA